jgi:hypothetical protein
MNFKHMKLKKQTTVDDLKRTLEIMGGAKGTASLNVMMVNGALHVAPKKHAKPSVKIYGVADRRNPGLLKAHSHKPAEFLKASATAATRMKDAESIETSHSIARNMSANISKNKDFYQKLIQRTIKP